MEIRVRDKMSLRELAIVSLDQRNMSLACQLDESRRRRDKTNRDTQEYPEYDREEQFRRF